MQKRRVFSYRFRVELMVCRINFKILFTAVCHPTRGSAIQILHRIRWYSYLYHLISIVMHLPFRPFVCMYFAVCASAYARVRMYSMSFFVYEHILRCLFAVYLSLCTNISYVVYSLSKYATIQLLQLTYSPPIPHRPLAPSSPPYPPSHPTPPPTPIPVTQRWNFSHEEALLYDDTRGGQCAAGGRNIKSSHTT